VLQDGGGIQRQKSLQPFLEWSDSEMPIASMS
jgi:hypothetical protein